MYKYAVKIFKGGGLVQELENQANRWLQKRDKSITIHFWDMKLEIENNGTTQARPLLVLTIGYENV